MYKRDPKLENGMGTDTSQKLNGSDKTSKHSKTSARATTITVGVVMFLLIGFFIATLVSQLINRFYQPLKTETALYYDDTEFVLLKGVYFRNERQVASEGFSQYSNKNNSTIVYTNKCGSKLANDTVVAIAYSSGDDIQTKREIEQLQRQLDSLSAARLVSNGGDNVSGGEIGQDNSQLDAFSSQLSDVHLKIIRSIISGDYNQVSLYKNDFLGLKSRISITGGETSEALKIDSRILELQSEISSHKSKLSGDAGVLREFRVNESGYFVNTADGYENVLGFDDVFSIDSKRLNEIILTPELPVDGSVIGKVIDDYRWRMVAEANINDVRMMSKGTAVKISIGSDSKVISAEIIDVREDKDSGKAIITLECELFSEEHVSNRISNVRLMLNDYSGIRLPQSAIRFNEDNEMGVYVKTGMVLNFKRVNMIRSQEDFVIVENTDNDGFLRLYDDVVISGKDLKDGKIVS